MKLEISDTAKVHETVVFLPHDGRPANEQQLIIGKNTIIRANSILYGDIEIMDGCTIDHYVIVREGSEIGNGTRLLNFAQINKDVSIGNNGRIGGLICNRAIIGKNCSVLGDLLHLYDKHGSGQIEPSPTVEDDSIIARGARVIGDVTISRGSYISANAVVSRSTSAGERVPPFGR